MKLVRFLVMWGARLPGLFSSLLLLLMLGFLAAVSAAIERPGTVNNLALFTWTQLGLPAGLMQFAIVMVLWEGLIVFLILLLVTLASYNISAWVYRRLRRPLRKFVMTAPAPVSPGDGTRLDRYNKIGIILAGGGAKGAYQAGAMKAIYEFLEANNALDKVKMIAGTSIGSWNAMFWLAGLVKPSSPRQISVHEQWWRSISLSRIAEFATYIPFRHNHFVLATPWQETFHQIFAEAEPVRDRLAGLFAGDGRDPIHFYFTRSNVERGMLEFSTNWPGVRNQVRPNLRTINPKDTEPLVKHDRYEVIRGADIEKNLKQMQDAVFASMDLPPLFPYKMIKVDVEEWFEDGGVVENLPVWFGAHLEQCDLLFVLPLNASFAEPIDQSSVLRRVFRVLDVRQGVIEQQALKMTYLYNELAGLREKVEELERKLGGRDTSSTQRLQLMSLLRSHKRISVFAICPQPPLEINTTEFWKPKEAGKAFDLMYAATKYELEERFEEDTDPNWIRMTLVGPQGQRSWVDDF